jgi:hypothetical protein
MLAPWRKKGRILRKGEERKQDIKERNDEY